MFSTPVITITRSENVNNTIQRKADPNNVLMSARKPFADISKMDAEDMVKQPKKGLKEEKNVITAVSPVNSDVDDEFEDYNFSCKHGDFYDEIWEKSEIFTEKGIFNVISNYCNYRSETPPPFNLTDPDLEPIIFENETFDFMTSKNDSLKLLDDSGIAFDDIEEPTIDIFDYPY